MCSSSGLCHGLGSSKHACTLHLRSASLSRSSRSSQPSSSASSITKMPCRSTRESRTRELRWSCTGRSVLNDKASSWSFFSRPMWSEPILLLLLRRYSTLHNYEHKTKGFSDFFVMFLFMLCNAGIVFETPGAMTTTIIVARGLGKVIGIMLFGYLATLCGGALPEGMDMRHLFVVGVICCVGLTVAIFVTAEAFPGEVCSIERPCFTF